MSGFTLSLSSHGRDPPHTPPCQAASSGSHVGKGKEDRPTANAPRSLAGHVTVPEKHWTPQRPRAKPNPSYVRGSGAAGGDPRSGGRAAHPEHRVAGTLRLVAKYSVGFHGKF